MKIAIENDTLNGPGFAQLKTSDSSVEPEGLKLKIETRGAKPFLGADGWQASDADTPVRAVHKDDDTLVISLGPDVVIHLREATYKVTLVAVDGNIETSRLTPKNILMPRTAQTGLASGATAVKEGVETKNTVSLEVSQHQTKKQPNNTDQVDTATTQNPARTDEVGEDKKSKAPLFALFGGVLLILCAAGSYWAYTNFLSTDEETVESARTNEIAEDLTPLERAKKFLAEGHSDIEIIDMAKKFWEEEHGEAGFLLMSRAAKNGNVQALIEMGKIYDPVQERSSLAGMPQAKAAIAYNYYHQAKQAGSLEVEETLTELRQWAETAAGEGNREASILLRLMTMQ